MGTLLGNLGEPVPGNLLNLFLDPLLGNLWDLFLGTLLGNLFLGIFKNQWEPVPGNLPVPAGHAIFATRHQ